MPIADHLVNYDHHWNWDSGPVYWKTELTTSGVVRFQKYEQGRAYYPIMTATEDVVHRHQFAKSEYDAGRYHYYMHKHQQKHTV
uniref:Uncharacterized protein n=1 Tax=Plectus sambesii TaxID=2011161 RepID=A0A914WXT3_9BILA